MDTKNIYYFTKERDLSRLLLLSNLQWQYVFDSCNDPMFILDVEYKILECNRKAEETYGYTKSEFLELSLADIRAPYTREETNAAMRKAVNEGGAVFETSHRKKDGSVMMVEVSVKPFPIEGELIYLYSVRDASKRKSAEEYLKLSEERYRKLVDFAPIAIFIICDNKILYANPAGLKLFGAQKSEQVIGMPVFDFIHPDYHLLTEKRISSLKTGMATPEIEEKIVSLKGEVFDVNVFAKPVKHQSLPTIEVFMHDITMRKRAEVYSSFLAAVVESSKNPIIVCSLDGSIIFWNKSAEAVYGYSADEIGNKLLFKVIGQASQDTINVLIEKVKNGKFTGNHKIAMKKKNGEIISVYLAMSPILGANGGAAGISIITQAIRDIYDDTGDEVY